MACWIVSFKMVDKLFGCSSSDKLLSKMLSIVVFSKISLFLQILERLSILLSAIDW